MKEKIDFKKSILFKSSISEITDINITHDYKIKKDTIEGEFHLSGLYKMTVASVKEEEFFYNIPFVIALSDRIKKESVNLILHDFNYEIQKDTLNTKMTLEMEYEENSNYEVEESIDGLLVNEKDDDKIFEEKNVKEEIKDYDITSISNNFNMNSEYVTYKVYITRQDDTFESIANKYNVKVDDIKEYNDAEVISIGDKIVIPYVRHD